MAGPRVDFCSNPYGALNLDQEFSPTVVVISEELENPEAKDFPTELLRES